MRRWRSGRGLDGIDWPILCFSVAMVLSGARPAMASPDVDSRAGDRILTLMVLGVGKDDGDGDGTGASLAMMFPLSV